MQILCKSLEQAMLLSQVSWSSRRRTLALSEDPPRARGLRRSTMACLAGRTVYGSKIATRFIADVYARPCSYATTAFYLLLPVTAFLALSAKSGKCSTNMSLVPDTSPLRHVPTPGTPPSLLIGALSGFFLESKWPVGLRGGIHRCGYKSVPSN